MNSILNGDCLDLLKSIPDSSVDLILTDLPYSTTKLDWDIMIPFDKLWMEYSRISKPTTPKVLFGIEPFSSHLRLSNADEYRYDWYWNKKRAANFLFMNKMPGKIVETISVFYKKQPIYNPQKIDNPTGPSKRHLYKNPSKITDNVKGIMGKSWTPSEMSDKQNYHGKNYEPDKLLPNNILTFAKPTKRTHPTEKPVELLEYLIKTYTNEGMLVLDSCAGTGSTAIACLNTNRKFLCIEKNIDYFEIAKQKIENKCAIQ